jgi:hypothetical protein
MKLIGTGLIIAGAAAAAGAAAFAGIKIYKSYNRKKAEKEIREKAREEFAEVAAAFSGLYEPLHSIGKGSFKFRTGVIGDWATRTANLANAANYQKDWNSRFSDYSSWDQELGRAKTNELLSFVFDAGICRDTAAQITVDSTTYKKFSTSDDEMIEAGSPARVVTPCWLIGDKILEKGIIEKI